MTRQVSNARMNLEYETGNLIILLTYETYETLAWIQHVNTCGPGGI